MIYSFPNYTNSPKFNSKPSRNMKTIRKRELKNREVLIWDSRKKGTFVGSVQNDLIKKGI